MKDECTLTRRELLQLFAGAFFGLAFVEPASAKDGDSSGGGDGEGDDGGGGQGEDDDGNDNDDDDGDDNSDKGKDHDDARDAVREGRAISLSKAMAILNTSGNGRVLEVKLVQRSSRYEYRFKVLSSNGKVKTVNMDASTGRIRGFLGL